MFVKMGNLSISIRIFPVTLKKKASEIDLIRGAEPIVAAIKEV